MCVRTYMYTSKHIHRSEGMFVSMNVCMYVCMHLYLYVCMYVFQWSLDDPLRVASMELAESSA